MTRLQASRVARAAGRTISLCSFLRRESRPGPSPEAPAGCDRRRAFFEGDADRGAVAVFAGDKRATNTRLQFALAGVEAITSLRLTAVGLWMSIDDQMCRVRGIS